MEHQIQIIGNRKDGRLDSLVREALDSGLFRRAYERVMGIRTKQKARTKQESQNIEKKLISSVDDLKEIEGVCELQPGKYNIYFEIEIPEGSKLILPAGVELYFAENCGITCDGELEVKGKKGLEVIISALDKDKGWKNIVVGEKGKAKFNYAKVSYGRGRKDKDGDVSGGAVSVYGEFYADNSVFEENSAKYGGAIRNYKGKVEIGENNVFRGNSAENNGGAIRNYEGKVEIGENNVFRENSAENDGGAIRNYEGELNIDKSKNTFIGNKPDDIYIGD